MLPDFIVIGAMKAGTTALFQYLVKHPQISMPWRKELDFFSNEANWAKGVEWYEEQFATAPDGMVIGEASPNYTKRHSWPDTPKRLISVVPDAKLIYMVRDPIVRMQSMYLDMLHYGGEVRSVAEVANDHDYISTSLYGWQLVPYFEHFGSDRILVETAERLKADRDGVLERVFRFLEVDPEQMPPVEEIRANVSEAKRIPNRLGMFVRRYRPWAVDPRRQDLPRWRKAVFLQQSTHDAARFKGAPRRRLEERFTEDARRLQSMVDVDLSAWSWYRPQ
ncbi:MAG: sulfotransferase [Acidimicrobiia bacterium]|nr:sulfotransferase domain-containing protein [Acidimicrobiia bacterium]MBT8215357.1 sulfotransferase domain-containing protein [Acidimicrobiia bacterium]NNF11397.1 sulfotransferase [Acidimicrobiia bacterium]